MEDEHRAARPLPHPSSLTRGFWDAAARRQLVRPVCGPCGRSFFTPQVASPCCHSEDWSYVRSAGTGAVYSFTVIHRPPSPAFEAPYVIADVTLDEGWNMMSNIVGCPVAAVHIDQRVAVRFHPAGQGILLPVFGPEEGP